MVTRYHSSWRILNPPHCYSHPFEHLIPLNLNIHMAAHLLYEDVSGSTYGYSQAVLFTISTSFGFMCIIDGWFCVWIFLFNFIDFGCEINFWPISIYRYIYIYIMWCPSSCLLINLDQIICIATSIFCFLTYCYQVSFLSTNWYLRGIYLNFAGFTGIDDPYEAPLNSEVCLLSWENRMAFNDS